jgi:hypothetical protein
MKHPAIVAVGGFSSEVGKTRVMCDLLRAFPGWEAIKMTRGHYRSCGKDPHACCVSDLLSNEPVIRSGRDQTYTGGKDTGRYWDAGASNVHWVIVTDEQVEQGIEQALGLVTAPGVFVEGNSFTQYLKPDFMLMVARPDGGTLKSSARRALKQTSALYINDENCDSDRAGQRFASWLKDSGAASLIGGLPIFTREDLPQLVAQIWAIQLDDDSRSEIGQNAASGL